MIGCQTNYRKQMAAWKWKNEAWLVGHIDRVASEARNGPQVLMEDHTMNVVYGAMGNLAPIQNRNFV